MVGFSVGSARLEFPPSDRDEGGILGRGVGPIEDNRSDDPSGIERGGRSGPATSSGTAVSKSFSLVPPGHGDCRSVSRGHRGYSPSTGGRENGTLAAVGWSNRRRGAGT